MVRRDEHHFQKIISFAMLGFVHFSRVSGSNGTAGSTYSGAEAERVWKMIMVSDELRCACAGSKLALAETQNAIAIGHNTPYLISDSNGCRRSYPNRTDMTLLSKMAPSGVGMARCCSKNLLQPNSFIMPAIRCSHANLFRKRPGQLIVNRIKDVSHFYFVGIGFLPVLFCLAYNHIVYGTCELKDYPTEGPPPHYWQFERTPIRQWWAKHFGVSDMEHHERNLAYYEKQGILQRWRQIEQRVKHLESERWDYKAWSYQPVSSAWVDYGRWHALRLRDGYEQHGHYAQ